MGVKLQEIIVRNNIGYQQIAGKIIAVDAPNIIMALCNFVRKNLEGTKSGLILDRTQRPISHLYGLLYRVNHFYTKKIFPIFCFDGRVADLKRVITKDQLKDFNFTLKWYETAIKSGNKQLAKQISLSKEYMWQNIIIESKQLLGALGVPYINSPASAESQCAYLVKNGIANYSNSQDFDSLLFGCPYVVQNLSKSLKRKVQGRWQYQKIQPLLIDLKKNLKNLRISIFQLVDIAILIGTDYFLGIQGIGQKKALTLIRKYKRLETVIDNEQNNYDFKELTLGMIKKVRKIFLLPDINEQLENLFWSPPNITRCLSLMCEEHHLNKKRVKDNLNKCESSFSRCREFFIKDNKSQRKRQITLDNLL